jgi:hypothetical protein
MENLLLILATTLILSRKKPNPYGFKKYAIGRSGCTLFLPHDPGAFRPSFTKNGDLMYYGEIEDDGVVYGCVTVVLKEPVDHLAEAEKNLAFFMQTLQKSYSVDYTAGFHFGYTQKYNSQARGIVDYWQDAAEVDWKLKGWTNGRIMSVVYVSNITDLPVNKVEMFLNSFQFA